MKRFRTHVSLSVLSSVALLATGAVASSAYAAGASAAKVSPINNNTLLLKAWPDECFSGVGGANAYTGKPTTSCSTGQLKVNQAYVWGLTQSPSSGKVWFGTAANVECLVMQSYLGLTTGFATSSMACEFGQNAQFKTDWRRPQIWSYVPGGPPTPGMLGDAKLYDTMPAQVLPAVQATIGFRSAGAINVGGHDYVFLAGPALPKSGVVPGINVFAFVDDVFAGYQQITTYSDIRQWIVLNGNLYTGVRNSADGSGRILLWTPPSSPGGFPGSFSEVGQTDSEIAYFAALNNRLYVTTWGGANTNPNGGPASGLWVSPDASAGPLSQDTMWTKLWDVSKYEVDPATAQTLAGGAISAYGGKLIFGLMQVPFTGLVAHYKAYKNAPSGNTDVLTALVDTTRAIPIFMTDGNPTPAKTKTTLLYGSRTLPMWNGSTNKWVYKVNASGQSPKFGQAGFGNPLNTYTWASSVLGTSLYFGTFDWSYVLCDEAPLIGQLLGLSALNNLNCSQLQQAYGAAASSSGLAFGADVWRFDSATKAAVAESINGLGNYLNYGVRTMLPTSAGLYMGMANPENLKAEGNQSVNPSEQDGGWELRILTPKEK